MKKDEISEVAILKGEDGSQLVPYDWEEQEKSFIDEFGDVVDVRYTADVQLFNFDEYDDAEAFAKQLKLMSLILRLKKRLGDDWEFTVETDNWSVLFNRDNLFIVDSTEYFKRFGEIYFESDEAAGKVADWLNKNYEQ